MASPSQHSETLRPWQFFILLALISATAAVWVVRGTSPENIILICAGIGAAAFVGIASFRALIPLASADIAEPAMVGNRTRAAIEREKNLVLRSIKELEFDHSMGKVSDSDFAEMTARLRTRAVRLLQQLDSTESGYREIIERELAARLAKAHQGQGAGGEGQTADAAPVAQGFSPAMPAGVCDACDTANDADAKFCKQCGAKLIAMLLLALCVFTGTARAQGGFQMPDPKQMSGIPRPVTDLPDGHISVRLIRGQLSNNITDSPVELHAGDKVLTVKTDENGRAEFSGVPGGTNVKAVAVVDGERLESQEFPAPEQGGIRLMLVATLKGGAGPALPVQTGMLVLGDQTRVVIDLENDELQVFYLLDVQNGMRALVNPPKPIVINLPTDAKGAALMGQAGPAPAVVKGNRVTLIGPFPPGQTPLQIAFELPHDSGDLAIELPLPVRTGGLTVLMKKVGAMELSSPQLPQVTERDFQGDRYVLGQAPALNAGTSVTLNISGLPHHSPVPRITALVVATFALALGFWAASRKRPASADSIRVQQLATKREKLFKELVRLEQQRRAGAVDLSRYQERRPALMAQLERVYRDLDSAA